MRIQKPFTFNFPITKEVVENLRIVTKHVGDLEVSGMAYFDPNESVISTNRYDVDIDFIKWNGTDIKEVLESIADINDIGEAAVQHASFLFSNEIAA